MGAPSRVTLLAGGARIATDGGLAGVARIAGEARELRSHRLRWREEDDILTGVINLNFSSLVSAQRELFASGVTLDYDWRCNALSALYEAVRSHEAEIAAALREDLGKPAYESYMCETGLLLSEITYLRRHLRSLMRPRRRIPGISQLPGRGELRRVPYGVTLIMSPWNYPLLLTLEPLAAALAAGNTAVVKPSAYSPATGALIARLIGEVFTPDCAAVVTGGRAENSALLEQRWDRIFFTGGGAVGREVLRAAAEHLTPVTLELGGKSPVIVDESADIPLAAKRIAAGKFLNCGQTCVAPDYVLCLGGTHDALLAALKAEISAQYPDALHDGDYGRIVNRRHLDRLLGLIDPARLAFGGASDADALKLEPTLLAEVEPDDAVMGEEIFGPILPLLRLGTLEEAIAFVESRDRPLALYLFTRSRDTEREVLRRCRFGGGCVNDTVLHLSSSALPFGGVGASGMGAYHGRWSYEEFTHLEGILRRSSAPEPQLRYRPFTESKLALLRRVLR